MSFWHVSQFLDSGAYDGARFAVMIVLCEHADRDTGECFPSTPRIAAQARLADKRSARRVLRQLEADGAIDIFSGGGGRKTNLYRVNMDRVMEIGAGQRAEREAKLAKPDDEAERGHTVPPDERGQRGHTVPPETGEGGPQVPPGGTQYGPPRGDSAVSPEPPYNRQGTESEPVAHARGVDPDPFTAELRIDTAKGVPEAEARVWHTACAAVARATGPVRRWNAWWRDARLTGVRDGVWHVEARLGFTADRLRIDYGAFLEQRLTEATGKRAFVRFAAAQVPARQRRAG